MMMWLMIYGQAENISQMPEPTILIGLQWKKYGDLFKKNNYMHRVIHTDDILSWKNSFNKFPVLITGRYMDTCTESQFRMVLK